MVGTSEWMAISAVVSAVLLPVTCGIYNSFMGRARAKKLQKEGGVTKVIGTRCDIRSYHGRMRRTGFEQEGTYEYVVDGVTYKYKRGFRSIPPHEIELYYTKNPAKAVPFHKVAGLNGTEKLIMFAINTAVVFVLLFLEQKGLLGG